MLCPLHEPAVFEMFKERGYAIAELNNVLYRSWIRRRSFLRSPAVARFDADFRKKPKQREQSSRGVLS